MATYYGPNMTNVLNQGALPVNNQVADVSGRKRTFVEIVTLAGQLAADITYIAHMPVGARFLGGRLVTDTSLGSTTIQIGIVGSTAKYKADAVFTATETPTGFGKTAATGVALTAAEDLIITWSTATAPSSGTLVVEVDYAVD